MFLLGFVVFALTTLVAAVTALASLFTGHLIPASVALFVAFESFLLTSVFLNIEKIKNPPRLFTDVH